jgi:hypothetical protein
MTSSATLHASRLARDWVAPKVETVAYAKPARRHLPLAAPTVIRVKR